MLHETMLPVTSESMLEHRESIQERTVWKVRQKTNVIYSALGLLETWSFGGTLNAFNDASGFGESPTPKPAKATNKGTPCGIIDPRPRVWEFTLHNSNCKVQRRDLVKPKIESRLR